MNIQDYIACVRNIHRDTNQLITLNYHIHQGMLELVNSHTLPPTLPTPPQIPTPPPIPTLHTTLPTMQSPPSHMPAPILPSINPTHQISRTPAQIVRRTQTPLNYVNLTNFLQPVPVTATSEQLNTNTTIAPFRNINNPANTSCPIRNEPFNDNDIVIQINTCGHVYFVNEFYGWFGRNVHCPLCRRDIRETDNSTGTTTHESATHTHEPTTATHTHESATHESATHESATHESATHESATHESATHEPTTATHTHEPTAHESGAAALANALINLNDLSHNLLDHDLFNTSTFDYDLSDISLNNNYHTQFTNAELENMQNDPQVMALQSLTETIATELTNQLQNNIDHSDLSNADIELSLSFGSH